MIIKFFRSGTSNGHAPVNYLLSDKDHEKNTRSVKPAVLLGDPDMTKALINSMENKWKYTSGVFSFRENEHPTDKELKLLLSDFLKTFAPGMKDRLDLLAVKHEDKGRLEVHFLVPRMDLETGKAFNIAPPGRKTTQICELFKRSWNERFGFEDVVQDPFKAKKNQFETVVPTFKKQHDLKQWVSKFARALHSQGLANNRDDLMDVLTSKGFTITRKGQDYVSVKHASMTKAVRLKGLAFTEGVDYKQAFQTFKEQNAVHFAFMSQQDQSNLKSLVSERRAFNAHRFEFRTRMDVLAGHHTLAHSQKTRKGKRLNPSVVSPAVNPVSGSPTVQVVQDSTPMGNLQGAGASQQEKPKQQDNVSTSYSTGSSSAQNLEALEAQMGDIDSQIVGLSGQLNHAKSLMERGKIQMQLGRLQAQKQALIARLRDARQQLINSTPNTRKP